MERVETRPAGTQPARISAGIEGLDRILSGGFLKGGVYLLMGAPGTGKTIFANQVAFHHGRHGGKVLYVTLLAESHMRMFTNLREMRFFSDELISESVIYLGAYQLLEKEGLSGFLKMLGETVRKFRASMLIIDGVASAEEVSQSSLAFKKFVHQLNSLLSPSGCTTFLLSSMDGGLTHPEHTMVDGIFSLALEHRDVKAVREFEAVKFRGSAHLQGRHFFRISDEGIRVFPRVESYLGRGPVQTRAMGRRLSTGVARLDEMLDGGIVGGSVTTFMGTAGTGKTTIGTQFLVAGAEAGEKGLYFSFYESSDRLIRDAEGKGLALGEHARAGRIALHWRAPLEHDLDEVVHEMLALVDRHGAQRLVVDGLNGLFGGLSDPSRMSRTVTALSNELRTRGVTAYYVEEIRLLTSDLLAPISDLSAVADNVVLLRNREIEGCQHRFLTVVKTRDSDADCRTYEMKISHGGVVVGDDPAIAAAILSDNYEAYRRVYARSLPYLHQSGRGKRKDRKGTRQSGKRRR
jgi:circadian clock protein KaiC